MQADYLVRDEWRGGAVSHHLLQKMKELLGSDCAILSVQSEHPLTLTAEAGILVLFDERRLSYRIFWGFPCSVSARNIDSSQKNISVTPTSTWIAMVGEFLSSTFQSQPSYARRFVAMDLLASDPVNPSKQNPFKDLSPEPFCILLIEIQFLG